MEKVYAYIDENFDRFVEELADLVRIPSVSAQNIGLQEGAEHLVDRIQRLGLQAEIMPMGGDVNPPLVYGRYDAESAKRTLFAYHHFDVQPPEPLEEWETPPFKPDIRGGRMFGRGAADNKGGLYALIAAIETLQKIEGGLPLNLRWMIDPQEEMGSPMMESFATAHKDRFAADFGSGSDGANAKSGRPRVNFGNRGSCYIEVRFKVSARDTHSGQFGGPIPNGAWRLTEFLQTLRHPDGRVAIEGFYDNVAPPNDSDRAALATIDFDEEAFLKEFGLEAMASGPGETFLEKTMFQPTCSICGFKSGYQGPGTKTVIPCEASAKIDMRLVKNQTPPEIYEKVKAHAKKHGFDDLELTPNSFQYWPSKTPTDHPVGKAIIQAVTEVHGLEPEILPSSAGSNPGYIFRDILGIPMARFNTANYDELNHAPNENYSLDMYRKNIKIWARALKLLAEA